MSDTNSPSDHFRPRQPLSAREAQLFTSNVRATCAAIGDFAPATRPRAPRRRLQKFATKTEILNAVNAVRATGIPIVSIDLRPDGTIQLSSTAQADPASETEFDRWEKAGKL